MSVATGICAHPIQIHADADQLALACLKRWIALSRETVAQRGAFHVALSGGSTPKRLYQLLAQPEWQAELDWPNTHLYFGDERAVPPDHPDSNFRMVREALLDHISLPAKNINRMHADPTQIEQNATAYAARLRAQLPLDQAGMPVFDLILLGMGPDGHTCSLFPDTPILQERTQPVGSVHVARLDSWRLSLTYPVLNCARQLLFLVAGSDKAAILQQICSSTQESNPVPVQDIQPQGHVEWLLDQAAAAGLDA